MESKRPNIFQRALAERPIVTIIVFVLFLFGLIALVKMPRQEFPNFTIRQGLVVGVYPGASASEVEEQLTKRVESFLFGFSEVKREKTYSTSKENVMIVVVELNDNVHDSDAVWTKLRHGLNELKGQLPSGVVSLTGSNDFGKTSNILLALEAKGRSYREMRRYMEKIEDELRRLPTVSKLKRIGEVPEQINLYVRDEKLVHYGIRPLTLFAALKSEGGVSYAGDLDDGQLVMPVHAPSRYDNEKEIAEQIVYADPAGSLLRLKDVARVVREYKDPDSYIESDGNRCLILSLEMQEGNNIVEFGRQVDRAMAKVAPTLPREVRLHRVADMPAAVQQSIFVFLKELLIAVLAVIGVTMLLFPLHVAGVAAVTIPITIIITLGILSVFGIQLHTVSLAALIIVLGMVVDNSIVIIDNHIEKLDHGETPWDAAWKSSTELFSPVFTAVLAIVSTYLPLAFWMKGMAGDFVASMPATIATALGVSLILAGFFVPAMCYRWIKRGVKEESEKKEKRSFLVLLQSGYDRALTFALKRPVKTVMVGLLTVVLGGFLSMNLPRQIFPKVERDQFAVEIYLPEGRSLDETGKVARTVASALRKDPRVLHVTSFIGDSSPRFHDAYAPNFPGKNYAQLVVNTTTKETAVELLDEYHTRFAEAFPNAHVRMKQLEMTSNSAPLEIRISGERIPDLKRTAQEVSRIMEETDGVVWVRNDYGEMVHGLRLEVKQDEANRLGLTKGIIATSLYTGLKGLPVATVWEGDYPLEVLLKREQGRRGGIEDITDQYVTSAVLPSSVPIRQVAEIVPQWDEGAIVRRNGVRTITVRGDVARTKLAADALAQILPRVRKLSLPPGVSIGIGGDYEAEIEDYIPLFYSMLTSVVLIFFILLLRFKKIRVALLIMCSMPLGILGGALGLLLVGYPLGFTALAGVLTLFGEVVRNGIILLDYAEHLRKSTGMSVAEVALAAGKRRLRPIFSTAAAAAVGVIPMVAGGSSLWGPMGTVICFGLIASTSLTLFVLPAGYMLIHRDRAGDEELAS